MSRTTNVTFDQLNAGLTAALDMLVKRDRYLLDNNANERSITHHLATYLKTVFSSWDVDVEYNRNCDAVDFIKRLNLERFPTDAEDTNATTVFPDIIVHERGNNRHNLFVVEVKKFGCGDHAKDQKKLCAFTCPEPEGLGYQWGAQIVIAVGKNEGHGWSTAWFQHGKPLTPPQPQSTTSPDKVARQDTAR